ncbi:MAG: peroxiredoxin [Polyangiaceae bacterium]
MLSVGDTAPNIDATTTAGQHLVLSQAAKSYVVVYFFPKAFTPGCTREAELFRDNYAELSLLGAEVIGVSTDDHKTQCDFAAAIKATFPMIADADKSISNAYDVLWPVVHIAHRVTFIVERASMKILAVFKHELAAEKHRDDVLIFLDALYQKKRPLSIPPKA